MYFTDQNISFDLRVVWISKSARVHVFCLWAQNRRGSTLGVCPDVPACIFRFKLYFGFKLVWHLALDNGRKETFNVVLDHSRLPYGTCPMIVSVYNMPAAMVVLDPAIVDKKVASSYLDGIEDAELMKHPVLVLRPGDMVYLPTGHFPVCLTLPVSADYKSPTPKPPKDSAFFSKYIYIHIHTYTRIERICGYGSPSL